MRKIDDLKLKVSHWVSDHKKLVIIIVIALWIILFTWNMIEKNKQKKVDPPSTTYTPHVAVMDNEENSIFGDKDAVPEQYRDSITSIIDTYFNYCNNGEYEKAYNLISEKCREVNYPTLEDFKNYVDYVFEGKKKIYNIQSYSIVNNKYIYNLRILDDIMANGTTDGYYYYEEKIVLTENNGEFKLDIAEFIDKQDLNITYEDDNMIIKVTKKLVDYETETYTVEVKNKTDKYLVIADNSKAKELVLDLGEQTRSPQNMTMATLYAMPNGSITQDIVFNKFYDDGLTAQKLIFGSIRILNEYNWQTGTTQENLDNAVQLYGVELKLK